MPPCSCAFSIRLGPNNGPPDAGASRRGTQPARPAQDRPAGLISLNNFRFWCFYGAAQPIFNGQLKLKRARDQKGPEPHCLFARLKRTTSSCLTPRSTSSKHPEKARREGLARSNRPTVRISRLAGFPGLQIRVRFHCFSLLFGQVVQRGMTSDENRFSLISLTLPSHNHRKMRNSSRGKWRKKGDKHVLQD